MGRHARRPGTVENVLTINKMIALIGNVEGVDTCTSVLINGVAASLTMTGTIPLPTPGTFTGVVS